MLKKIQTKLKSDGVSGLVKAMRQRVLPQHLEFFPECRAHFETGSGLEIGGASPIFRQHGHIPVYPIAKNIDNINFAADTVWEGKIDEGNNFVFNAHATPGRQYVGEASNLEFINDSTYDFVLSSHCIEHLANPLQGLSEWMRVLKEDGLLVLVVPHKDGTFDHRRPVTSLDHLLEDFDKQTAEDDLTHLAEILELHDLDRDPEAGDSQSFKERSQRNLQNRCLHQHVFDTRLAVATIDHMGLQILSVELFLPYHIAIIARKTNPAIRITNDQFKGIGMQPSWKSPFPSDLIVS